MEEMTTQLVLQFKLAEDVESFDKLILFEDALSSILGKSAVVDGHDFGSREMNIFIYTDDHLSTFALVQQTDLSIRPSQAMTAGYRLPDTEEYVCLWPPELEHFEVA